MRQALPTPTREQSSANGVLMAAGITASIFLALTAYMLQSRVDFSFPGAGLFATAWVLGHLGSCHALRGWI